MGLKSWGVPPDVLDSSPAVFSKGEKAGSALVWFPGAMCRGAGVIDVSRTQKFALRLHGSEVLAVRQTDWADRGLAMTLNM